MTHGCSAEGILRRRRNAYALLFHAMALGVVLYADGGVTQRGRRMTGSAFRGCSDVV